jgi:hypothetical protein
VVSKVETERAARESEVSAIGHIRETRANAESLPGFFKLLTLEHAELLGSLLELQHWRKGSDQIEDVSREELLENLVAELAAHEEAERRVLYARLHGHPKYGVTLDAQARDSENVLRVAHQLETLPPTNAAYAHTLRQLTAMYQQHTRLEETELFMNAQHALDAKHESLRLEYLRAKARVQHGIQTR